MIRPRTIAAGIALALAACLAQPAAARSLGERIAELPDEQKAAIGVRLIDVGATIYCLDRGACREVGPMSKIFGGNPSALEVAGTGIGSILISSAIVSLIQDKDPATARTVARINLLVSTTAAGVTLSVAL